MKARTGAWAPGSRRVTATRPTARAATVSWRGGHLANFAGAAHFDMDATAKSVHVGRVPVKAAGISETTCRVRLSGVPVVAAGG